MSRPVSRTEPSRSSRSPKPGAGCRLPGGSSSWRSRETVARSSSRAERLVSRTCARAGVNGAVGHRGVRGAAVAATAPAPRPVINPSHRMTTTIRWARHHRATADMSHSHQSAQRTRARSREVTSRGPSGPCQRRGEAPRTSSAERRNLRLLQAQYTATRPPSGLGPGPDGRRGPPARSRWRSRGSRPGAGRRGTACR